MKKAHSLALLAAAGPVLADTSGSIDVLSMNVAGLPPIFNGNDVPGDKDTNSRAIGSYFAEYGYDIIHVQEVGQPPAKKSPYSSLCAGLQLPRLHLRDGRSCLPHAYVRGRRHWLRPQYPL